MPEGPGTELAGIIERWFSILPETWTDLAGRLLIVRIPSNCGCYELADQMDAGGVQWCEENREAIIEKLIRNAIRGSRFGAGRLFRRQIRRQAERWLDEALRRAG